MRIIRFDELPLTPWKNGGGTTREVLCFPEGAGMDSFDYRISIATISKDGPFSSFPGVDRTLALVEGDGVTLEIEGDRRVVVNEDTPVYQFGGEQRIHAIVNAGTTMDFNVMTRRARCRHSFRVQYHTPLDIVAEADLTLVFVQQGPGQYDSIVAAPGEHVQLEAQQATYYIVEIWTS